MSIFRLKNNTGQDSRQAWANDFTFPNGVPIDLMDSGTYGSPAVPYSIGLAPSDLIGIQGGRFYENVATLIRSGKWRLNDGDTDLVKEDALIVLKYGSVSVVKALPAISTSAYKSFLSHNFADPSTWPTPGVESKFVITPNAGTTLHLLKAKIMMTPALKLGANDEVYYRVFAGNQLVLEERYGSAEKLFYGAATVFTTDQVGDPNSSGARALIHAGYIYEQPISLKSSIGMRLEIGLKNNDASIAPANSLLSVRLVARPEADC